MTTQTEQQGSHQFVITLSGPSGAPGLTVANTCTPRPGETRHDVYLKIRRQITQKFPQLADATVLFFSIESNEL